MPPKIILSMMTNMVIFVIISAFHYFVAVHGIWMLVSGHASLLVVFAFVSIAMLKYTEKKKLRPVFELSTAENAVIGLSLLAFVILFAPAAYSDPDRTRRIILLSAFEVLMLVSGVYYYWRYLNVIKRN
ncbi:hypothetical protein [Asticcacaulis sp.]|uniref:hypothetical protein n=1 Tax=Asticcacaulis sp. TaxID=1872648 RepID=UPI003F7C0BE1